VLPKPDREDPTDDPELRKAMLEFHQTYPPLFRRSGKSGKQVKGQWIEYRYSRSLPPEVSSLVQEKGNTTLALVPQTFEDIPLQHSFDVLVELSKLGYDEVLNPGDGSCYFEAMHIIESDWTEAWKHLHSQWSQVSESFLRCGRKAAIDHLSAWEKTRLPTLTDKQRRVIDNLTDLLENSKRWRHMRKVQMEAIEGDQDQQEWLREHDRDVDKAILKASRLDLDDHPIVADWIVTFRGLGARSVLRRGKKGLEKGVKPPIPHPDNPHNRKDRRENLLVNHEVITNEYYRLRAQGHSFKRTHALLADKRLIPNKDGKQMSRQALQKMLTVWGIL